MRVLAGMALLAAAVLVAPSHVLAFEEVGNNCAADDAMQSSTLIGDASNRVPPPHPQVPQGDLWTITGWKVNAGPGLGPLAQQLAIFRFEGSQSYRKVAESAMETVVPGANRFQTRIPVMEFAAVGLHGPEKTLVCRNDPLSLTGVVGGDFSLNSTRSYEALGGTGVPVVAIVEPDVDLDRYGDETQDACPWTAAYQADCPSEKIEIVSTAVKRRAILVEVRPAYQAPMEVFGQVGWVVRPKHPRGPARRSRNGVRRVTASLSAGRGRSIGPARTATFKLPLPSSVQRQLGQLAPRQALQAKLTVRATDSLNGVVERKLTVKLPGRER
jgi:hypothetical protein